MNKLESEICRILDFSETYLQLALKEAINKQKLQDTYMFVNGELRFIDILIPGENSVVCSSYDSGSQKIEVDSLEVWNPETGIYSCEECSVVLLKKPIKQWKKSFHPNNYTYTVTKYGKMGETSEVFIKVAKEKPEIFSVIKNKFFMYGNILSVVKDNCIVSPLPPAYQIEATKFLQEKGIKCPNLL